MAISNKPAVQWWSVMDGLTVLSGNTICYGPYSADNVDVAKENAIKAIRNILGEDENDNTADPSIPIGWTIGVIVNNLITEYWLTKKITGTITPSDLIEKLNKGLHIIDEEGNDIASKIKMILE